MLGIGLRVRFFLIIFAVLLVVAVGSVIIHDIFLRQDRMALIDQQVRNTAASLIDAKQGDFRKIDFVEGEKIVSKELGPSRTARMFLVKNDQGQILYESKIAKQYQFSEMDVQGRWSQNHRDGKFIRILSLDIPEIPNRSLHVGYVMDEGLVTPNYLSSSSLVYLASILFLGFAASLILTSWLLKPVALIGRFLTSVSDRSRAHPFIPSLPESMFPKAKAASQTKDEFTNMVTGLNALISIVNQNYRFSRLWAYQMAHELKTPLAILNLEIERIQRQKGLSHEDIQPLTIENLKISETINSFLAWAELENAPQRRDLFANRVAAVSESICKRLESSFPGRVKLEILEDASVIAAPQHLEQIIFNLLGNGLSYSDPSKPVIVRVGACKISFIDFGSGIPADVLSRLGEPFNRSDSNYGLVRGNGLGLAWVHSICRHYSWKIDMKSQPTGTQIDVCFPYNPDHLDL